MSWLRRKARGFRFPNGIPRAKQTPTIRLWDEDFNLMYTGSSFPEAATVEHLGRRYTFKLEFHHVDGPR